MLDLSHSIPNYILSSLDARLREVRARFQVSVFLVVVPPGKTLSEDDKKMIDEWSKGAPKWALISCAPDAGVIRLELSRTAEAAVGSGYQQLTDDLEQIPDGDFEVRVRAAAFLVTNAILGVESPEPLSQIPILPTRKPERSSAAGAEPAPWEPATRGPASPHESAQKPGEPGGEFGARVRWLVLVAFVTVAGITVVIVVAGMLKQPAVGRKRDLPDGKSRTRLGGRASGGHGAVIHFRPAAGESGGIQRK